MSAVVELVQLPSRHSVPLVLENLLERDIAIADGTPAPAKTTNVIGLYVTARLATAAIAVLDLEGAARYDVRLADRDRSPALPDVRAERRRAGGRRRVDRRRPRPDGHRHPGRRVRRWPALDRRVVKGIA